MEPLSRPPPLLDDSHAAFIQGRVTIGVSSRDAANVPSLARTIGCRVSTDRREVTVFVTVARAAQLLRDLRDGGPIAVVFTRPSTHETLQLKAGGAALTSLGPGDTELLQAAKAGLIEELRSIGHDARFSAAAMPCEPGQMVAVTFTPSAAFVQTPGPGAGRALAS